MLGQRIATALVLLALLLPSLAAASPVPFILLTLLLIAAAGWEWARLNGVGPVASLASGALLGAACAAVVLSGWQVGQAHALWWVAAVLWVLGGAVALRAGPQGWPQLPLALRWPLGLALLWLAWNAMAHARIVGVNFLLSTLCVVWVADIAAYFSGRAFGKHKLAPSISPGKSWEGVYGGVAGVLLLALGWGFVEQAAASLAGRIDSPSLFTLLQQRLGLGGMAVALLALAAMSVVGDLFESLVKRAVGAKDSSRLLPGHGGVLDRVDALLPVLPIALALISL
jgi:phosphatidate cytidylyltransferase